MVEPIDTTFVVIAGGKGTRSINPSVPKSLHKLMGETIIEHQLSSIAKYGPAEVIIVGGFGFEALKEELEFLEIKFPDLALTPLHEENPQGTLGALMLALDRIQTTYCVVILGDIIFDCNLENLLKFSVKLNVDFVLCSHPNAHPEDSDQIHMDLITSEVKRFFPKGETTGVAGNLAAAGIYCVRKDFLKENQFSFGDITKSISEYCLTNKARIYSWITVDYVADAGTPARIEKIENDMRTGTRMRRSGIQKDAIFLDLDDTLLKNVEDKSVADPPMVAMETILELKRLNQLGIPIVVATNQPGIAKGHFDLEAFGLYKAKIESNLSIYGAFVDAWEICPHHPEKGWENEVADLKIACECRKPKPGLLLQAAQKYGISLPKSVFLGDSIVDLMASTEVNATFLGVDAKAIAGGSFSTASILRELADNYASD